MSYYYAGNLDSFNRLDQIEIQLDNGDTAILRKGHYYDLTAGELARARQYITLTSSTVPADERPVGVYRLMVKGNPDDGDIPVWEDTEGAFIPQVVSGVSGGPYATVAALNAVESGSVSPVGIADTDTVSYDTATTKLKPLRRDWRDVEEFTGTDSAKLLAAASACATDGKIMRWKRGKTYSTTATLDWTTALNLGNLTMECEGAEILKAAAVYAMRADGTESAKVSFTADVPAKSFTVTLPTGQGAAGGWAMGHIIMLESALDVFGPDVGATVKYVRAREQHEVYKVVGDVLTLSGPTLWAHTTANSARYSKITPTVGRLVMRGGLQVRGNASTDAGYLMRLTRLRDPLLEDITARDHSGGLQFFECLGGRTKRYASYRNPSSTNPWYYSASMVGANVGVWIDGYTVRGGESEASFTTLADERAPVGGGGIDDTDSDSPNGDTFWGGSIDCGVTDGDVELGVNGTCYGSHSAALNFTYENCKARGGLLNFYMRSIGMKLIGCSGRASSARAVGSTSSAEDSQIIGGEFYDAVTEGIALSAVRQRVIGAHVHHCATGIALSADDDEVIGSLIRENTNYGVQCSGGNNKRIVGNKIPKGTGGAQAVAVLNLGAADVAHDNECKGFGSTNPFITPTAGAIAERNIYDAIFTINAASTLTIHQVRPTKLNAGTGTVDNITATGWAGREITFILNGAVTFKHFSGGTGNLRLHGAVDFVGTASDSITLICDGTNWFQKSPAAVV